MLVLSRKRGEKLRIGDQITVEVRRVRGDRVTIAVEAPLSIKIVRGELIRREAERREGGDDGR